MTVTRVLFVCLGNICRSPTAEGVFRKTVAERGLSQRFEIDSAGTGDWHIGSKPDHRACAAAARRGVDLNDLRARQVADDDFAAFDYIVAMDRDNYEWLRDLADDRHRDKVFLFLELCSATERDEVPDPYYGGEQGFDQALDLIEQASADLLDFIVKQK